MASIVQPPSTAAPTLPSAGEWFVLHSRPRQEKVLAADLGAMGVSCFLPTLKAVRFYGKRKRSVQLPMFSGYLFLRGTREQAYLADRTKRVAQIIDVPDQERLDSELRQIHMALSMQAPLDPYPFLKEGVAVVVRSGPFQGLEGLVEKRMSETRLILQIETLGQATSLEIDASLLEPIE